MLLGALYLIMTWLNVRIFVVSFSFYFPIIPNSIFVCSLSLLSLSLYLDCTFCWLNVVSNSRLLMRGVWMSCYCSEKWLFWWIVMSFWDGVLKANKLYSSWNGMIAQQVTETCWLQHLRTFFLVQTNLRKWMYIHVWWYMINRKRIIWMAESRWKNKWRDEWANDSVVFTHLSENTIVLSM